MNSERDGYLRKRCFKTRGYSTSFTFNISVCTYRSILYLMRVNVLIQYIPI